MKQFLVIALIFVTSSMAISQMPNRTKKLIGKWQYKSGDGFEVWRMNNDHLTGAAYRITKNGDTTQVESLTIKRVNKTLVYILETNSQQGDSIVVQKNRFISSGNKLKFNNIETNIPSMISYSFCFFTRNRLKIKIQFGVEEEPIVLELKRYKASKN